MERTDAADDGRDVLGDCSFDRVDGELERSVRPGPGCGQGL